MSGFPVADRLTRAWLPIILCSSGLNALGSGALNAETCLVLSPATITGEGTALLDLSLYSSPGAAPAALQWTLQYPPSSVSSITVENGPMLTAAGKTAICTGDAAAQKCLTVGLNTKIIGNGVIARVTAVLRPGARTAPISITDSLGASAAGNLIPLRIQLATGAKVSSNCKPHPLPGGSDGAK